MSDITPPEKLTGKNPLPSIRVVETPQPTQVVHSWKTALRTGIQSAVPTFVFLLWLLPQIQDFIHTFAPESPVILWIAGATTIVAAAAALLAKVMAHPLVNEMLTKFGLGAEPKETNGAVG